MENVTPKKRSWLGRYAVVVACAASAAFIVGGAAWAFAALSAIGQPLIIRFNGHAGSTYGIDQVGGMRDIWGLAFLSFAILVVNTVLAVTLDRRDTFLGKLLAFGALVYGVLIFLAFTAIIRVN